jgi:uncharacterized protein
MPTTCPTSLRWSAAQDLSSRVDLGPGLDQRALQSGLERLCRTTGVQALIAFGSRGRGEASQESDLDLAVLCPEPTLTAHQKTERWLSCRQALGLVGCDVDLVVIGHEDAARLAQSRWHVMRDVAREGRVLYVAG